MKTTERFSVLGIACATLVTAGARAQDADADALAQKLSNPVADLISVPFQLNWDTGLAANGLGDKLLLTFDPSWQYVLANGGGTTTISERPGTSADVRQVGASGLTGWDLNGDGDVLDTVRFYTPNNTNTRRWGATTSLIYNINDDQRVRFAFSWDRARHRQTAQWGYILGDGPVEDVFAGRQGQRVYAADGDIIRGRDRFSIAELNQYALEYRGQFMEDKLIATVGVRAPFFTRELNQYCYTPNGGTGSSSTTFTSSTLCTSRQATAGLANGNVLFYTTPTAPMGATEYIPPWSDEVKFDDRGKKGKSGEVEAARQTAEMWMRNIQTTPAQLLRRKFAIEVQGQKP